MADWKVLVDGLLAEAAQKFYPGDAKAKNKALNSPVARMVASLPFISECPDAEALARKNLNILFTEETHPGTYPHRLGLTLRQRLAPGDIVAKAAKPDVAEKGMLLLELASLLDHKRDRAEDLAVSMANPLNEGMEYQAEQDRLTAKIKAISSPDLDGILTADSLIERSMEPAASPFWYY